jgi:translocation and assembly module TamB
VQGRLTAQAEAGGTLVPRRITSRGEGRISGFRTGVVDWGDVPLRWTTGEDAIEVAIPEARPFGGGLSASARIPTRGDGPITGTANLKRIDLTRVAAALPGDSLRLDGRADGRMTFAIQPRPPEGTVPVEANVQLEADDLAVQGVPARAVRARMTLDRGDVAYELEAESLGGKVRFRGTIPLAAGPAPEDEDVEGRIQILNVALRREVWDALGMSGALASLQGRGALDANMLLDRSSGRLRARGIAEVRDLRWGARFPLGRLRGTFAYSPDAWEVRPLTGELFGGTVAGTFAGRAADAEDGERWEYHLQIDRASLARLVAFEPGLDRLVEGEASLRLDGFFGEAVRADGELLLPRGRVVGLELNDLRAPLEVSFVPASNVGNFQSRRWGARLAGGHVLGDLSFRFGTTRSFRAGVRLTDLDLESLSRSFSSSDRPMSGKVSGRIELGGLDALRAETYQGRADIELTDAQLLDTPIFRALDRFLGGPAGGGVFERGSARAAIGNGEVSIEELALFGRVVQLHATGTIGFDTRLELVVLINTNQIIPQTGQALFALIPGLRDAQGSEASLRVANFLSNRLIKLRVGGTLRNPSVTLDPSVTVGNAAVSFFAGALKLPLGLLK